MSKKRRELPAISNIEIQNVAAEGKAITRHNEKVVFITGVVPGDVVDLQVIKKRKSYMEAIPTAFHKYSDLRVEPKCQYFGTCGGCKWQFLSYDKQLEYKHQQVIDNLTRIGKIELPEVSPILGSATSEFYRNKLEFTFSNMRWLTKDEIDNNDDLERNALGFHIPGRFDKILDIDKCYLQADPSNAIRNEIKKYALEHNLEFFDLKHQHGFLRTLIIRTSSTGEIMVIVAFFKENKEERTKLLEHIKNKFPEITSLMYVINSKPNDTITDQNVICYHGNDHIFEEMEGLKFKIGPKSFYQTNSQQAYELYKVARDYAQLTGNELVYDLYTGTGTIANFVAKKAKHVVGVEYVPEAIEDAKVNSSINNITNTSFYAGDMKDVLNDDFIKENGRPNVIITDPPRAGMHQDVVNKILEIEPQRIVYVSCNPATQARDLQWLSEKYVVEKVQPVDMFPHTHHVENVVSLIRKYN